VSSLLEVILLVAFAFCMGMMSSSLPSSAERTRRWMANRRQRRQVLLERSPGDLYGEHGEIVLVDGQTCRYGTVLVREEQAKLAEVHGWRRVGLSSGGRVYLRRYSDDGDPLTESMLSE
jgi:hypothetical protein